MKLSFEQIKNVTVGALWMEQKENGIVFHKCTASQEAAWRNLSEGLGTRSETTTGIRLDFHTDSETLVVDAADGDKFEVYINGLSRYRVHAAELRAKGEKMIFSLGKGEKRVTLIFPSHGKGVLTSVELDDGATLTRTYLGPEGLPVEIGEGYCEIRFFYDAMKNLTGKRYYNANGTQVKAE